LPAGRTSGKDVLRLNGSLPDLPTSRQGERMKTAERSAQEWFQEAARCYIEHHQGCAWCGGAHQVYQKQEGGRVSYSCHHCDFRAGHDEASGRYVVIPGEPQPIGVQPGTMLAF
jgi:hypothetical protein